MKKLCDVFNVNRSSFRYWQQRSKQPASAKKIAETALVKELFDKSEGSAGARSISDMTADKETPLSRYRVRRLMKKLSLVSCQIPNHIYKKTGNEYLDIPNHYTLVWLQFPRNLSVF